MLSASSFLLGNQLRILTDADESISFQLNREDPSIAEVLVNGQLFDGAPTVQVSSLESLYITAGQLDNTIDLTTIDAGTFFNLTEVRIETGDGHDTIIAPPDLPLIVFAGDGNDTITGGDANDTIDAGDGDDSVTGGLGNDSIDAGDGEDFVAGDEGNDFIQAGDGRDTVSGNDGDDTIRGDDGHDLITGDLGNDLILADHGNDTVNGNDGDDTIFGGSDQDSLNGNAGDDIINGQGGHDSIEGADGNDSLYGSGSSDTILGGDGNDFARGDAGVDFLIGGDGDDTQYGGAGGDFISGQAGADMSFGNAGRDTLQGADGADTLDGGTGDDLIDNSLILRPPITVNNVVQDEGSTGGTTEFLFTLSLPNPAIAPVMVDFATVDDTAIAGEDYTAVSGTAIFDVGVRDVTVSVQVNADAVVESTEMFFLELTNPIGGTLNNMRGVGQIVNDDGLVAPGLNVAPTLDAAVLTSNVVGTSSGIVVTDMTLQAHMGMLGEMSAGTYTAGNSAAYGLNGTGIILSTGDVANYGNGPDTQNGFTTSYGAAGTPAQELLLDPITGGMLEHNDVTQLDISFDLEPGFDTLFFELVFGSEEFPDFVGSEFIDAFGIYLNGTNIATFNGSPVNVDHPDFQAVSGTELNAVLAPGGNPRLIFSAPLSDGQTGNTITFIIADSSFAGLGDDLLDSTVYIASLGGTVPGIPAPAPPTPLMAEIVPATISGGSGNDTIIGGGHDDFIDGGTGSDSIQGLTGADRIFGGGGNDTIEGNEGPDTLIGNGGSDFLDGGADDDTILWREKDFRITVAGGTGSDTILALGSVTSDDYAVDSDGSDLIVTLNAAQLTVQPTVETVIFNQGNGADSVVLGDLSAAGLTELRFNGEGGDDVIDFSGSTLLGNVVLVADGGEGDDTILGSSSSELIFGGAGDDKISGGVGNDTIEGGDGADLVNGQQGDDSLRGGAGNDVITGGDGNDTAWGDADNDTIDGENGDDTLFGNFGADSLIGSFGDDSLNGGLGKDNLIGGAGNDRLDGGNNDDTLLGSGGNDSLIGNNGNDFIRGNNGNDTINGGDGDDTLNGDDGDDLIGGFSGSDQIGGGNDNDTLTGGDGDDTLLGGGAGDELYGDQGADALIGNGGSDRGNPGEGTNPAPMSMELVDSTFEIAASLLEDLNSI